MLYIKDSIKKNTKTIVKSSNPCLVLLNKTTKIMVNQPHAPKKRVRQLLVSWLRILFLFLFL